MNPTEQGHHRRVTDTLAERLDAVEPVLAALDERVSALAAATQASIGGERTHRLKQADAQRGYVDHEDRQLRESIQDLQQRTALLVQSTVWSRLRWILIGRY